MSSETEFLITPVQWELYDRISEFLNFLKMNGIQLTGFRIDSDEMEKGQEEEVGVIIGRLLLRFVKMSSAERQKVQLAFSAQTKRSN